MRTAMGVMERYLTDVGTEFALSAVKQSMEQQQALTNGGDGASKKNILAKERELLLGGGTRMCCGVSGCGKEDTGY